MMKVIALVTFIVYVDCLSHSATLSKPFYVSRKYFGQDVVFRIVKGIPAKLGEVPYQVALMAKSRNGWEASCGGTIIARSKVLSAAHCVENSQSFCCPLGKLTGFDLRNFYVVAGNLATVEHRAFSDGQGHGQWRSLSGGIYPKSYKFPKDDIVVLFTVDDFVFNEFIRAVPIARTDVDYGGKLCTISGYGHVSHVAISPVLLYGKIRALSKKLCNFLHGKNMTKFVCIDDIDADAHKGDSGGPLVCKNTGDKQEMNSTGLLVGVVCGKIFDFPKSTFFTRVSSYREFIESRSSNELHKLPLYLSVTLLQLIIQLPGFF